MFLRDPLNDCSDRAIGFAGQRRQWTIGCGGNIVFRHKLAQVALLQIWMEFDLIDHRLVLCDLEDLFEIYDSEIRNANIPCKAYSQLKLGTR